MRKYIVLTFAFVLFSVLGTGCAGTQYGKLSLQEKTDAVTIQTLQKNWQDYIVYYAGLDAGNPSAVMFDRKDDDRVITTERWYNVKNKALLDDLIDSIQRQSPFAGYYPRLWKICGPDGYLYGYMFTSWDQAATVMKSVNEKTLLVYDLPLPPYLAIGGPGAPTDMRNR
jgi:hypothetical protein